MVWGVCRAQFYRQCWCLASSLFYHSQCIWLWVTMNMTHCLDPSPCNVWENGANILSNPHKNSKSDVPLLQCISNFCTWNYLLSSLKKSKDETFFLSFYTNLSDKCVISDESIVLQGDISMFLFYCSYSSRIKYIGSEFLSLQYLSEAEVWWVIAFISCTLW